MKFEIGQEVVCIKSHEKGYVTKDKVYIIKNIIESKCNCNECLIDIGLRDYVIRHSICGKCRTNQENIDDIIWLGSSRFIPIQKDSWKEVTFEDIKEPAFLCAN